MEISEKEFEKICLAWKVCVKYNCETMWDLKRLRDAIVKMRVLEEKNKGGDKLDI
ncbi:MAG: hypothetical protein J7L14_02905 [Candidatus Diapherotrites archaeon]|nr:hypothetical protein [Candidatus Diapherotrites archaeon]